MVGPTKMELIASDKRRHLTFQGRVKGMKKKAYELSTLCGLDIGMIICSPSGQQIETLSWSNQQDDAAGRNTLLDLIASYKNQDGNKSKKTVINVTRGISKQKAAACESSVKSKLLVSELEVKSEKELRESAMCIDSKIERVKEGIEHLKMEKQPQTVDDTSSLIQDYGTTDDDLVFWLNQIMDEPDTPIQEDSSSASAAFASNNDITCHSNIPAVMTTGGDPMTSQVMIGHAAVQDFTCNSYLHDAPHYTNDQLSYNPYPWMTTY